MAVGDWAEEWRVLGSSQGGPNTEGVLVVGGGAWTPVVYRQGTPWQGKLRTYAHVG